MSLMKRKKNRKRKWSAAEVRQWRKEKRQFFYCNKEDANIFIKKQYGINWTFNFGNPLAYAVIVFIFAVISLLILCI